MKKLKIIIAGGRDYTLSESDYEKLKDLKDNICEVVSGGAKGVDTRGKEWAKNNNIKCSIFIANWNEEGKEAGIIRNRKMARYADAVILFPGGTGTKNMYKVAKELKLKIWDYRK